MGRQKLKLSKGTFYITFEMPHLSRHLFPENICSNLLKQLQNYVSLEIVAEDIFWKVLRHMSLCHKRNLSLLPSFDLKGKSSRTEVFTLRRRLILWQNGLEGKYITWDVFSSGSSPAAGKVLLFLRHRCHLCLASLSGRRWFAESKVTQSPNSHMSDTGIVTLGKSLLSPSQFLLLQYYCLPRREDLLIMVYKTLGQLRKIN